MALLIHVSIFTDKEGDLWLFAELIRRYRKNICDRVCQRREEEQELIGEFGIYSQSGKYDRKTRHLLRELVLPENERCGDLHGNDDWEIEDMIRETTGEKEVITKIGIDSQPRMIMSMVR